MAGSNNFDNPLILDSAGAAGDYFGFGRASGGTSSTKTRIYNAANLAALDQVVTAPKGSRALLDDGGIAVNKTGQDDWVGADGLTVADPGTAGAIPVSVAGPTVCVLTSAGAETRTLADPAYVGQQLMLAFDTDGGDIVLTAASAVNQTGNNTLTFADAGDQISLRAASVGGAPKWRVMSNDGVALSTV